MSDNGNIRMAADRLQEALRSLEDSLGPLLKEVKDLRDTANEAESFKVDRIALATQLDEAKAREDTFTEREKEFSNLADETMSELCLLYTSPSPRDLSTSRMPSSA